MDRLAGAAGYCHGARWAVVSSSGLHFGEEAPLVGRGGSGTIFLAGCNLGCCFCQNSSISTGPHGQTAGPRELAALMLQLQRQGAHNVNLVTPTHYLPQILEALLEAVPRGLRLPLVWNCGGYESLEALRLLDGIVDIYMPDVKFFDAGAAARYMNAPDYPEGVRAALLEMQRQVGDLVLDERGIARRGLLIRHLVMPGYLEDTERILGFLAAEVSRGAYVNVMAQYHPAHRADRFPELMRRPTREEYARACALAWAAGLRRGFPPPRGVHR